MDLTVGCKIRFMEAVFSGCYPNAKYDGDREIVGTILKDSYGKKTGQHTFTIEVVSCTGNDEIPPGSIIKRKGRNVYKFCEVLYLPTNHAELADDKHDRSIANKKSIGKY